MLAKQDITRTRLMMVSLKNLQPQVPEQKKQGLSPGRSRRESLMHAHYYNSNNKKKVITDPQKPPSPHLSALSGGFLFSSGFTSNSTHILGKTISHYKILEKIGEGGMGYIYKAFDMNLQRSVALKILPAHLCKKEDEKNQFLREARLLSSLEHPYICTIHDIFESDEGALYMVMTCYHGKNLRKYRQENQISMEKAISIVKQIASGLIEAHEKGIVHQDIKPENVIITSDDIVKIIDFGVAQLIGHNQKGRSKTSMGTLVYMSPEQTSRISVDHRTDIWSLGIVFYEMLSGKLPFDDEFEQAIVYSILNENPPVLKNIPKGLSQIVLKCLEKDRNNRYQNMREMLTDLEVLLTRNKMLASIGFGVR